MKNERRVVPSNILQPNQKAAVEQMIERTGSIDPTPRMEPGIDHDACLAIEKRFALRATNSLFAPGLRVNDQPQREFPEQGVIERDFAAQLSIPPKKNKPRRNK